MKNKVFGAPEGCHIFIRSKANRNFKRRHL